MGAWGIEPWGNDRAADWYGDLLDEIGLAQRVERALQQDVPDAHEEIRAAALLLLFLGRVYIWPVDDLDRHLELAATKLEEIRDLKIYDEDEQLSRSLDQEIALLRARLVKGSHVDDDAAKAWWLSLRGS